MLRTELWYWVCEEWRMQKQHEHKLWWATEGINYLPRKLLSFLLYPNGGRKASHSQTQNNTLSSDKLQPTEEVLHPGWWFWSSWAKHTEWQLPMEMILWAQIKDESKTFRWRNGYWWEGRMTSVWGVVWFYLHVGEGAGQGAGTRPPLLLQSSAQHLKLPLLLPHWGQQGGRTRTLLHSHAESRSEHRTGKDQHQGAGDSQPTPGLNLRHT